MSIKQGEILPESPLARMGAKGPEIVSSSVLFAAKKAVLFGLPGAFTPTCSASHLPGFVAYSDKLFACGIDEIFCVSVNDAFVMDAWGKTHNADGVITLLGDGNGEFAEALGIVDDRRASLMNQRMRRFAMVLNNQLVEQFFLEAPGEFKVSSAEAVLAALSG